MNIFGKSKKLGFGLMRLPLTDPKDDGSVDVEETKKMVDIFLANGFTYFDTAIMYCKFKSESTIKEALTKRYPHDKYTIATKLHAAYVKDRADCDRYFAEQKEKIGVDYFDYYLLHDIGEGHYRKYQELDAFHWLQERKAAGDVRHIGFSYHDSAALLDKVLTEHPEMEFVQLQLNYIDWESEGIQARKCYEVAEKHGKPVIVMEPVKGGTLAKVPEGTEQAFKAYAPGLSVASWAIRFAASLPNVAVVLSGMSNMAQMNDNISFIKDFAPLNEAEKQLVENAVKDINSSIAIPCTGCSYCTEGCPQNIPIPRYFSLYNADLQECAEKGWKPQQEYYDRATASFGKASQCEECGQCEEMCPQHLPVIEHLKTVADYFEK